ncbi:MAG: BatD family protein [Aeromonadaceae bacterium]
MVRVLIFALLFISSWLHTAWALEHVTISVDKSRLYESESLQLLISADDRLQASALQLTPLFRHFIVGEIRFNERTEPTGFITEWQIPLLPRQSGSLTIPSLTVATLATRPLAIQVLPGQAPQAKRSPLLEASLEQKRIYPQQVALYTLKVRLPSNVQVDSVSPPMLGDKALRQLGDDQLLNEIIAGRRVKSLLRYYAVQSDKPGQEVIQGPLLQGIIQENGKNNPFLQQAPNLLVTILPQPKIDGAVPSQELRIEESWQPSRAPYLIGTPIIRQIRITAVGNLGEQLPIIEPPRQSNLRSYDDGIQTREQVINGQWVVERTWRQALLPQQLGTLSLPEIKIPWWDTQTQQLKHAHLPAVSFEITQGSSSGSPAPQALPGKETQWPWLAAGVLLGALCSALLWLLVRHHKPTLAQLPYINDKLAWRTLKKALRHKEPAQIHQALLRWGQQRWPEQFPVCIEALPCYPELHRELDSLLAACYSSPPQKWDVAPLRRALLSWRERQSISQPEVNPDGLM